MKKSVLWIRTDSIGDNILASGMLAELERIYGPISVTVACQEYIAEIYERLSNVEQCITWTKNSITQDRKGIAEVLSKFQGLQFDLVLNSSFQRESISDLIAAEVNSPEKVAWEITQEQARQGTPSLKYDREIPAPAMHSSELFKNLAFLSTLADKQELPALEVSFQCSEGEEQFAETVFQRERISPANCLALHAGAQSDIRKFHGYGTVLKRFLENNECSVIALGAGCDRAHSEEQLSALPQARVLNLCGETSLGQAAAILKRARLSFGAETGLAHLACAVGTPQVVLLGGGHFGRFMPYSKLTTSACLPLSCFGCDWKCQFERALCVDDVESYVLYKALELTWHSPHSDLARVIYQRDVPLELAPDGEQIRALLQMAELELIPADKEPVLSRNSNSLDILLG